MVVDPLNAFNFDALAQVMTALIVFISLNVSLFSMRYMLGERRYGVFFTNILFMSFSLIAMVSADNVILFVLTWIYSNCMLVKLMTHNSLWKAAVKSGNLARNNFILGSVFLTLAVGLLSVAAATLSISQILAHPHNTVVVLVACILLTIAGMAQSAIWPFHRWLLSSLNAPTPVSALMHAGLVNGGGFLILRFWPLFSQEGQYLLILLMIGLFTAILGSLLKLLQSDIKRMLACSTVAQMGFMFVQLGLGLFVAAICHLMWHGMFKAYLFLSSGSTTQTLPRDMPYNPSIMTFMFSIMAGLLGSYIFAISSGNQWIVSDTSMFLNMFVFIIATQSSLSLLDERPLKNFLGVILLIGVMTAVYGFNVLFMERILSSLNYVGSQPMSFGHGIIALVILGAWLINLYFGVLKKITRPVWIDRLYVAALNMGLPHRATVTANRNDYKY